MLAHDHVQQKSLRWLSMMWLVIILIYNVVGPSTNTSTRTNQNGPESYGFRERPQPRPSTATIIK
jgi:hypothetical protein